MNKKGFTLLELLVVILIMSIVSVSSVIVFDRIDDETSITDRKSMYKSIQRAASMYVDMEDSSLGQLSTYKEVIVGLSTLMENNYVSPKLKDPLTGDAVPSNYLVKLFIAKDETNNDYLSSCIINKNVGNNKTQCISDKDGEENIYCCAACPYDPATQTPALDGTVTCN